MNESGMYLVIGLFLIGGLAVQFIIARRRHQKDHRQDLEPILAAHGLTFVSAKWPGMFKVGPFPKFEFKMAGPQSRMGGVRGEYTEYRIVTCQDSQGNKHLLWVQLEFELFQLTEVRWRVEEGQDLPSQALGMVEK